MIKKLKSRKKEIDSKPYANVCNEVFQAMPGSLVVSIDDILFNPFAYRMKK